MTTEEFHERLEECCIKYNRTEENLMEFYSESYSDMLSGDVSGFGLVFPDEWN